MLLKLALICEPVTVTTTFNPAEEFQTEPDGWLGGLFTWINTLPAVGALVATVVYVPLVGGALKYMVTVVPVELLLPVSVIWPGVQPGVLQLEPPTVRFEFWLAVAVVATVPVVVTCVVFGFPPVPVA